MTRSAFFVWQMNIGDLVEVTDAVPHQGESGLVESIEGQTATVHPVDVHETGYTSTGPSFQVSIGSIVKMPTQSDLRREKAALRAKHIASLEPARYLRPPNVRTFHAVRSRNKRPL